MVKLEKSGSARQLGLRREAEGAFARAERVAAVLRAREKDAARRPLDRAGQLEAAAAEAAGRGELDRAFGLFAKVPGHPLTIRPK